MRTLAIDAAKQLGFDVSIRPIEESELATADEIWVTSSGRVLASCVSLNGKVFGAGKPAKMACAVINCMRLAVENLLVKTP
jgi:branched-subunit amino acid aminotransferase/4-amino-4-deoxychorismate lyase